MKHIGMVHTAVITLLLGATASFGYAQHDDKGNGQDRQDRQAQSHDQQHGQQRPQEHAQPPRAQEHARQEHAQPRQQEHAQQQHAQDRHAQDQHMRQDQQRNSWQRHRGNNFDSQHRTWAQLGGYDGYRVPEARFRAGFGAGHSFHIGGLPFMEVGGRPRFQYGGYWFSMMEPYPEYWGNDWYQNDDMYVDYNDGGYYLHDRRFPRRPGVAISVSF